MREVECESEVRGGVECVAGWGDAGDVVIQRIIRAWRGGRRKCRGCGLHGERRRGGLEGGYAALERERGGCEVFWGFCEGVPMVGGRRLYYGGETLAGSWFAEVELA